MSIAVIAACRQPATPERVDESLPIPTPTQLVVQPTPTPATCPADPEASPPYVGYTVFNPADIDWDVAGYTNFLHIQHRVRYEPATGEFEVVKPTVDDLERARASGIKLIVKLDRYLVEDIPDDECRTHFGSEENVCGFNAEELSRFRDFLEPYRDMVLAIYPVNEPYKPANRYSEEYLTSIVDRVRAIFDCYLIYNNFLSPYWSGLGTDFPGIPEGIDLIGFDSYHMPGPEEEEQYKAVIGSDIEIIQDRARGRPVILGVLAYRVDHDRDGAPDDVPALYQAEWDYELYLAHDLAGLRWFFLDDYAPPTWYGASHWADVIEKHRDIGQRILGVREAQGAPTPEPTASATARPAAVATSVPTGTPTPAPTAAPRPTAGGGATAPQVITDIVYGDPEFGAAHMLDLYLPGGVAGEIPTVIWFHGGGLSTGDKAWTVSSAQALMNAGFAVATANYRLTTDDHYLPAQIHDAKAVVRWVRANADVYGLDADHVGVIGGSAGAFLAASLGTSCGVDEVEGQVGDNLEYSSCVQAAVPMAGVYDFFGYFDRLVTTCEGAGQDRYDGCYARWFFGCSLADAACWDAFRQGSAISYVSAGDPPFLLLIGDHDATPNGLEDHRALHEALVEAGVDSTLIIVPGAEHGAVFDAEQERIIEFFDTHLRSP